MGCRAGEGRGWRRIAALGVSLLAALVVTGCGGAGGPASNSPAGNRGSASIAATPATVVVGDLITISVAYSGGSGTVDHGIGPLSSGAKATYRAQASDVGDLVFKLTVNKSGAADNISSVSNSVHVINVPPVPEILAPTYVTVGRDYQATTSDVLEPGWSINWDVKNGLVVSGQGTGSIVFRAEGGGAVQLSCAISSSGGNALGTGALAVTAVEPPKVVSFSVSDIAPKVGASVVLTPVFSGGEGSISGLGPVSSGGSYDVSPLVPTDFTLVVVNQAGDQDVASVHVAPQLVAMSPILPSLREVSPGSRIHFQATVTGAVDASITWSASAGKIDAATGEWEAPSTNGPCTITATSNAVQTVRRTVDVAVSALPKIDYFVVE